MFEQKSMLKRMFCILGLVCVLFLTACGDHHTNDGNGSANLNSDLYGTWYLNQDGNLPVKPNTKNDVSYWIFNSDGSFINVDYVTTENEGYIQTDDMGDTKSGTWNCDSKVIKATVDGETDSVEYRLSSDKKTLTLTVGPTDICIYKKDTKPSR